MNNKNTKIDARVAATYAAGIDAAECADQLSRLCGVGGEPAALADVLEACERLRPATLPRRLTADEAAEINREHDRRMAARGLATDDHTEC